MKKQGFSIMEIIVFLGLIALIIWGLDYITTKDFVIIRTPVAAITNDIVKNVSPIITTIASSTPTSTPLQIAESSSIATSSATSTGTKAAQSALTVSFTSKGFSPTSLTIKKGQTVTFVNNSAGQMWVSANPFPSGADYPAFNEKNGAAAGASWSFTFDKTGTWFYHNHFSPAQGAKIVVNAK
jgi:plastocyanin